MPIYQTTSYVFEDIDHAATLFALQRFGKDNRLALAVAEVFERR